MAPISKDVETLTATTTPTAAPTSVAPQAQVPATRPQPVPLEVPVSVNGARTIEGTDKREPFSESTKTVLVFANGAVIRLASSVSPGQLLFVTNEKSKKEVVCQVVKSKNYRTVTGYVELEFTEPAVGFWGVRIPVEAPVVPGAPSKVPVAARPASPVAAQKPVAPKVHSNSIAPAAAPSAPIAVKPAVSTVPPVIKPVFAPPAPPAKVPVAAQPAAYNPALEAKVPEAAKPETRLPTIAEFLEAAPPAVAPPSTPQPPAKHESLPAQLSQQVSSLLGPDLALASEVKANIPVPHAHQTVVTAPANSAGETTDELRQQAARLQEQLSSLLFRDEAKEKPPVVVATPLEPLRELASAPKPAPEVSSPAMPAFDGPKPVIAVPELKPVSTTSNSKQFNLKVEEVKIPSWLVPLARETESESQFASATATPENTALEGDARIVSPDSPSTGIAEKSDSAQTVVFGNQLLGGAVSAEQAIPGSGSKKGVFFGLAAAAALVIGGGLWYGMQPGNFLAGKAPAAQIVPASNLPQVSSASASSALTTPTSVPAGSPTPATSSSRPAPIQTTNVPGADPSKISNPSATPVHPAPAVQEQKKPVLGDVHLATPSVNRNGGTASNEAAPSIDATDAAAASDPLLGVATSDRSQPAVPAPVGGDVKPAQLLKSVPPVYPSAARTQRVAGEVKLDALIDVNGNVTSTKILSGPPLLHLAAVAAVKQWKYQPAMLDGKPTSMHLTVTVQFRLQ